MVTNIPGKELAALCGWRSYDSAKAKFYNCRQPHTPDLSSTGRFTLVSLHPHVNLFGLLWFGFPTHNPDTECKKQEAPPKMQELLNLIAYAKRMVFPGNWPLCLLPAPLTKGATHSEP